MIRIIALSVSAVALLIVLYLLFSKKQKPWNEMTKSEQDKKKILVAGGLTVFLTGLIAALLLGKKK